MVFVFYVVFGDGTLLLLTPDGASPITGDILQSLPATSLMASFVRLSMTFVCLVSFPLCMVPASEVRKRPEERRRSDTEPKATGSA